jgi:hypothetical protein
LVSIEAKMGARNQEDNIGDPVGVPHHPAEEQPLELVGLDVLIRWVHDADSFRPLRIERISSALAARFFSSSASFKMSSLVGV